MQLITTTLAFLLIQAIAAAPNPNPQAAATTSAPTAMQTAEFTGEDNGLYDATSISGTYLVAGHALTPGGAGALVGGGPVTAASSGLVYDGQVVEFLSVTSTSSSAEETTSSSVSTTSSAMASSSSMASETQAAASTSSGGAAAAGVTGVPMAGAVFGGVVGFLLL